MSVAWGLAWDYLWQAPSILLWTRTRDNICCDWAETHTTNYTKLSLYKNCPSHRKPLKTVDTLHHHTSISELHYILRLIEHEDCIAYADHDIPLYLPCKYLCPFSEIGTVLISLGLRPRLTLKPFGLILNPIEWSITLNYPTSWFFSVKIAVSAPPSQQHFLILHSLHSLLSLLSHPC